MFAMPDLPKTAFKQVPAVRKCFAVLQLFASSKQPLGLSEISKKLDLNKSTVFNLIHTLVDLGVLEHRLDGKFGFGTQLYLLGRAAAAQAELIKTVHPFLEEFSRDSNFSTFLGIRSGLKAVIVDKVDAAVELRVASEVGMRLPLHAGASGKALLCQLSDSELDDVLAEIVLEKFTPSACVDKAKFKQNIIEVRKRGVAVDIEEYMLGLVAVAVPLNTYRPGLQAAIWAVGLTRHASDGEIPELCRRLKAIAQQLDMRFCNL
jgi:IclR family transcriptional regulator, KDG regulon repressor